jgi:hypothetical protein
LTFYANYYKLKDGAFYKRTKWANGKKPKNKLYIFPRKAQGETPT